MTFLHVILISYTILQITRAIKEVRILTGIFQYFFVVQLKKYMREEENVVKTEGKILNIGDHHQF